MPEEQSVYARDGVADPHGCGNPLRSGIVGLSAAPDSQPPAIFPTRLSHLKQHAHPLKATPKSQQERPAVPEEQSVWPAMAWPIRMDAGILCDRA